MLSSAVVVEDVQHVLREFDRTRMPASRGTSRRSRRIVRPVVSSLMTAPTRGDTTFQEFTVPWPSMICSSWMKSTPGSARDTPLPVAVMLVPSR